MLLDLDLGNVKSEFLSLPRKKPKRRKLLIIWYQESDKYAEITKLNYYCLSVISDQLLGNLTQQNLTTFHYMTITGC